MIIACFNVVISVTQSHGSTETSPLRQAVSLVSSFGELVIELDRRFMIKIAISRGLWSMLKV